MVIEELDDDQSLSEVFPALDLDGFTPSQLDTLRRLVNEAMRPLVETGWERRGHTVHWRDRKWNAPYPGHLVEGYEDPDGVLGDLQVLVWGEAYDQLDAGPLIAAARACGD